MEKQITFGDYLDGSLKPSPSVNTKTSKESAKLMDNNTWKYTKRKTIYDLIKSRGSDGATCDEIEVSLELRHQSTSSLIRSLVKADLLYATHEQRITRSGRKAIVWKTTLRK